MRELASIRKDINSVDSAIRELFLLRMSLAHEVAETKAQSASSTSPCSRA